MANPASLNIGARWGGPKGHKLALAISRENPLSEKPQMTVPETNTRGRGEYPKVLG